MLVLGDGVADRGSYARNGVLPPLPRPVNLAKVGTSKMRKGTNVKRS
jgi:hypothetical protein